MEDKKTNLVKKLDIGTQKIYVFVEGFRSLGYWLDASVSYI